MTIDARLTDIAADDRRAVVEGLHACIVPTLRVDERSWQEAQSIAVQNVATTAEIVQQGDVLVRKGQRVDAATIQRLAAYRHGEALRSNSQFSFLVSLGALGHAAVLISIIVLYLYFIRRTSYLRNGQLATLVTMPVISAVLGWLTIALPTDLPLEYSIIVPGFAMLVSILYDARTSIVVTLVCSLAVAAARGNDHVIAVVLVVGGAMAAYSATNLRSRTQVFTSIAAIFVGLAVVTVSISLERATPLLTVLLELGGVAVNAVVSPLLAIAIVLVMERSLNIATDLRLEDFDNINHPLLQQLNERAPGTYQHTMAVARLSESAAAAIGANALLARVGALYHDIGKIEKSEYFIENQIDIDNKHDRLPPKRSAAIIRQHVQDGVELAREYRLPERIWKFIPMHHGTIVIKHFYALAVADAQTTGASVDEADFRYPGPKPDGKETAIVMLADVCEAISRLVDTSHREDIERAVEQVILDRITDGQLSEAPLTLADLDTVRESFVKSLLGSSHQRVRYRDVPESTDSSSNS
jgi:putative nucleotidyltransferase with HDIG domain